MATQTQVEIVELFGRIDASNSDTIRQIVKESLAHGAGRILIDCRQVTSLDSSGISTLIVALKLARSAGGKLALCSINDRIRMMLQLTGLEQVFEVFSNRAEFEQRYA